MPRIMAEATPGLLARAAHNDERHIYCIHGTGDAEVVESRHFPSMG